MKVNRIFAFLLLLISCILFNGCANEKGALEPENNVTPSCAFTESEKPEETDSFDNITIDINASNEDYKDDDGELLLSFSGASASATIKDNIAATNLINASLTSEYGSFIAQVGDYVSLAANDYNAYSTGKSSFWNSYYLARNIAVGRSDSKVISIVYSDDYYLGGAHGGTTIFAENYDAETGKTLTLADLAADKQTLIDYIIPYLLWLTQKPGFADGLCWADEDTFKSIVEDDSWYLSENGLVIICNEYTIGPYVIGSFNLEIPYVDLSGVLLDKWIHDAG
jgi:hypothetical protein